jgi:hypothetical protein
MNDWVGGLIGIAAGMGYLLFFITIAMMPMLIDEYLNKKDDK